MFGFFKKKAEGNTPQAAKGATPQGKPKKAKSKNEQMRSVLKESVVETVVAEMFQNEAFVAMRNGKKAAMGLLLDSADIGGISKKQNKDEAKGSMVEQINGSGLKALITSKLLDEEKIVFLPDAMTLNGMSEYGILSEAPYHIAFAYEDNTVEETDIPITFSRVVSAVENEEDSEHFFQDVLQGSNTEKKDFISIPEEEGNVEVDSEEKIPMVTIPDDVSVDAPEEEVEVEDTSDMSFPTEEAPISSREEEVYPEATTEENDQDANYYNSAAFDDTYMDKSDYDEYGANEGSLGEEEEEYPQEGDITDEDMVEDEEDAVTIPEETVKQELLRVFASDELPLTIRSDLFDQYYPLSPFRPFVEDRGDGRLERDLSQMAMDANSALDALHEQNWLAAREEYMQLLTEYCEKLQKELDYEDSHTEFGEWYFKQISAFSDKESDMENVVIEKRKVLQDTFTNAIKEVREQAANRAEADYRSIHSAQQEELSRKIPDKIREELDGEKTAFLKGFHEKRRSEAKTKLEYGISEALVVAKEKYQKRLDDEVQVYEDYRNQLVSYLKENRETDLAHDALLREELLQNEKATKVMAEMTAKLEGQTADFKARRERLLADLDAMKESRDREVTRLEAQHADRLKSLQGELDASHARYQDLVKELANVEEKKNKEYKEKLVAKDREKEMLTMLMENAEKRNKKNGVLLGSIALIAVVAALLVGLLFGSRNTQTVDANAVRSQVEMELQQRFPNGQLPPQGK